MADRPPHLPNYPMPPGFPMNLAAMQQQKQQQAQPPHTMHAQTPLPAHLQAQTGAAAQAIPGGMPNTDSQRMWQQIQETHRQQMGGGEGMAQQQITPQVRFIESVVALRCARRRIWRRPSLLMFSGLCPYLPFLDMRNIYF